MITVQLKIIDSDKVRQAAWVSANASDEATHKGPGSSKQCDRRKYAAHNTVLHLVPQPNVWQSASSESLTAVMKACAEAMKCARLACEATKLEKYLLGKFQPPMDATTFMPGFAAL